MIKIPERLPKPNLAVVVTCHQPYVRFLNDCLQPITSQARALRSSGAVIELTLCLDHVTDSLSFPDWKIIHGNWRNPNGGRNAGLLANARDSDWILFWDVDNIMPAGFLDRVVNQVSAADPDVGILYPFVQIDGRTLGMNHGADLRENFYVDTASAWRVNAVLSAGRWDEASRRLDDWSLSRRVAAMGWQASPLNQAFEKGIHGESRSSMSQAQGVFEGRSLGILSLLRGKNPGHLDRFFRELKIQELPPKVGLTLMDNSGDDSFNDELHKRVSGLGFSRVSILTAPPVGFSEDSKLRFLEVHNHIAYLYGLSVRATPEESILFWEDDVFPQKPDAIRNLSMNMLPGRRIGIIAALYPSRNNRNHACAARDLESWTHVPRISAMARHGSPVAMGAVGGGFTLYNRVSLERNPVRGPRKVPWMGWDGDLCRRTREDNWSVLLHTGVVCDHCFDE